MTEREALRLALKALEIGLPLIEDFGSTEQLNAQYKAITAIYEALAQPEPCGGCKGSGWVPRDPDIGTDQECFVCGGSGAYPKEPEHGWTSERIAGMARLKEAQDKRMVQQEQPKVRTGNCLRVGVCASEGHKIAPQRTWVGLTDGEVDKMILLMGFPPDWTTENAIVKNIVRNLEAKLKERNG
jgi:hypothetical protein